MKEFENPGVAESIEVVSGNPSSQELAAIVAVLGEAVITRGELNTPEINWARGSKMLRNASRSGDLEWRSDFKGGI